MYISTPFGMHKHRGRTDALYARPSISCSRGSDPQTLLSPIKKKLRSAVAFIVAASIALAMHTFAAGKNLYCRASAQLHTWNPHLNKGGLRINFAATAKMPVLLSQR
jgi:hypothetical protein